MNCLSPSILSADFANLGEQIRLLDQAGAEYVHIDVMDGMFVQSISFAFPIIRSIRKCTDRIFDVHLMIEEPIRYIDDFVDAGADIITVHAEACRHLDRTVEAIREKGVLAGVALNPATPLETVRYILPKVDMLLIMTVNPGFGGQKLIPYTLDKVREARNLVKQSGCKTDIEVDGGINLENVEEAMDAGQCNDSYSLAIIAMKLQEVFGLKDINDLTIVYNIAWYEQKAVIVLLALLALGVKKIHLGPTLPAFLSPNVKQVLIDNFGIGGISTADEDIAKFLA